MEIQMETLVDAWILRNDLESINLLKQIKRTNVEHKVIEMKMAMIMDVLN